MTTRARLLDAHAELTASIRASEAWEKTYTDSPATFKRLVREEGRLQASATDYLLGLSDRVPNIVNWSEVALKPIQASAVPPQSDEVWKQEMALLTAAVSAHLVELAVIGANAGEYIYDTPLGITSLDDFILQAADRQTAELVTQVNDTTRRGIQKAIKQSIANGEDVTASITRIRKLVANPVRAEMIAQTESVNAYNRGLLGFLKESGAKTKTWEALLGACKLCSPLHGKTIPLDEHFVLPNGTQVMQPAGHTRCRCGIYGRY